MHAIVRPGPYICAEWDNGGLPAWLFGDPAPASVATTPSSWRRSSEYFEQLARSWFRARSTSAGPMILVQIENEYGAYGADGATWKSS